MKTWHIEHLVVLGALTATAIISGSKAVDWLAAGAVLCSFGHASVSDRLVEREATRIIPEVECAKKAAYYWVAKELLWVATFISTRTWPALVGCGLFLAYPFWRKFYRKRYPLNRTVETPELCSFPEDESGRKDAE